MFVYLTNNACLRWRDSSRVQESRSSRHVPLAESTFGLAEQADFVDSCGEARTSNQGLRNGECCLNANSCGD